MTWDTLVVQQTIHGQTRELLGMSGAARDCTHTGSPVAAGSAAGAVGAHVEATVVWRHPSIVSLAVCLIGSTRVDRSAGP
jgi:hypothetical protein